MKCNNCKCENKSGAVFCKKCGNKLDYAERSDLQQDTLKRKAKIKADKPSKKKTELKVKVLASLQVLIYLVIAALNMFFMFFRDGVRVKCSYSANAYKDYSFFSVLMKLISGGERYNPTVVSIIIGVGTLLLVFSCAVFWLFASGTKICGRFHRESHVMALIISFLNLLCMCISLPLAYKFSGILKAVYAREANFPISDITSIYSVWSFVVTGVMLVLIVLECIILSAEKKALLKAEVETK